MKKSKILLITLILCFAIGCEDKKVNSILISEEECRANWAICTLIPERKVIIENSNPIKIAILDSGIKDIQELNGIVKKRHNILTNSSETTPIFEHGTMVASIVAGATNEDTMIGMKSKVELFDVQVLDEKGRGTTEDLVTGINWSVEQGADIINISHGLSKDEPKLRKAIVNAHKKGVIIVAATGNTIGLSTDYPAKYPEVLSISAIDENLNIFSYAGIGKVDFVAPGVNVPVLNNEGKVVKQSGTSFSTAYATGMISILLQSGSKNIINKLNSDAKKLGPIHTYGNGLIQIRVKE